MHKSYTLQINGFILGTWQVHIRCCYLNFVLFSFDAKQSSHSSKKSMEVQLIQNCKFYLFVGSQEQAAHAYDIAAIEYRGIKAVTNFDLSTYIRWLRPGANSLASQQPKSNIASNPIANQETTEQSIFHSNSFTENHLDTLRQLEVLQSKTSISPCTKSSTPSALDLLLRSSLYRELTEKNLNTTDKDTEESDTKILPHASIDNGVRGFFCNEIGNNSYMCSNNGNKLPGLESPEEIALPFYHRSGQSFWNDTLGLNIPH